MGEVFSDSLQHLLTLDGLMALLTLTVLEIVLGIDNLVFISLLVGKVALEKQRSTRTLGLALALVFRIALLFSITWIIGLTTPILTIREFEFSWRDLILLAGGIFLLAKSTLEIHEKLEQTVSKEDEKGSKAKAVTGIILQVIVIDMVFSIDSILTAVGLTNELPIMILAVVVSMIFMMAFAGWVSDFIHKNPTIIMLALSFLLLIGVLLIADAFHYHLPRGYVYFAMGFSLLVEILNIRLLQKLRSKSKD